MTKFASPFDWGEAVRVTRDAPREYRPGSVASVCGFRERSPSAPPGTTVAQSALVLVEYEDGSSLEIPVRFVEKAS